MPLELPYQVLEDLLLDPKFAAEALMGWKLDDYQSAALKLDWWFPYTIDSSGTMSGKTLRMFILLNLRAMLLEDQLCGAYFQTWSAGQQEFWPYFQKTLEQSPIYRSQCLMDRRKYGGPNTGSVWQWRFDNGSKIEMPAPGFINDARTAAGRSFNTLCVDEWCKVEEMGEGIAKQLIERSRRPLPAKWSGHVNSPIRGNHLHLKGHAEALNHKAYARYRAYGELIHEKGSSKHARYSFCWRDISDRFSHLRQNLTNIIATQQATERASSGGLGGDYSRRILGLWKRDGATFYPHGMLERGAQEGDPELGRTSSDAHYFLGYDPAPAQSVAADPAAAAVLRLRPVAVKELPRLADAANVRFFRMGDTAWEMRYVFGWMARGLSIDEMAGFVHHLDARFGFTSICMDPGAGGGGPFVKLKLLEREAVWAGQRRKVTPICTRFEPSYHDKRPILHMFRKGGDFDGLPFVGPDFTKGDDGFLAAMHMNFRERWSKGEVGYSFPLARRPRGFVEANWSSDMVEAQRMVDEGIRQIGKVTQQTDANGHPIVSKPHCYPLFHSPTKKDLAYSMLYAMAVAELWLWQNFGDGSGQGGEADGEGCYT